MRSWIVIALAVALFITCSTIFYQFTTGDSNWQEIFYRSLFGPSIIFFPFFGTIRGSKYSKCLKIKGQHNELQLSLFKGREAKLNRAILLILFQSGPLVVYDITKVIKKRRGFKFTKYTNINRRVRALLQQGYLETVGSRQTQSGSHGTLYQATIRAKVAFYFNLISPDQFIKEATDDVLATELAAIALFLAKKRPESQA